MKKSLALALDVTLSLKNELHGIPNVERKILQIFQNNLLLQDLNINYICYSSKTKDFRYVYFAKDTSSTQNKQDTEVNISFIHKVAIKFRKILNQVACLKKSQYTKLEKYNICNKVNFNNIDFFISVGGFWDLNIDKLETYRFHNGFKLITMIHDLIPINRPFATGIEISLFKKNLDWILNNSFIIFTPSNFVKTNVKSFIEDNCKKNTNPIIKPLLLAANVIDQKTIDNKILTNYELRQNKYAVIVCTIDHRKNHRLLINIWREMHIRNPNEIIPLVIVGFIGGKVGDLINEIKDDTKMKNHIILTGKVDDATRDALLANARFSLFQSFEEGFGLPIAESLAFGVPCITADNSSLPEAGQGLTEMIDLLDTKKWYETILKYITDDNLIAQKKEQIKNAKLRTWQDFENDFVKAIEPYLP